MSTHTSQDSAREFDETAAAVCLSMVAGIGPRLFEALLDQFETASAVLAATSSELKQVPGIGKALVEAIVSARESAPWQRELEVCREQEISIFLRQADIYPKMLKAITDPPNVLYCRGNLLPQDEIAIAIVGTRHATHYGRTQAERLARGLAHAGYTVVSGLARGIDAAAHEGAMKAGGRTIAVLGSGLMNVYPPEHQDLANQVIQSGALVSEFSSGKPPRSGAFPQRNRIVTGLSLGVIVVEAAERSGALISARLATEQNREVFAVPGRVDSRGSRGCHQLIRDGATLVESVEDVLEELGPLVEPIETESGQTIQHPAELQLNEQEQKILQAIDLDPTDIDQIVNRTQVPVSRVLSTISILEVKKLVRRISGSQIARRQDTL